MKIEAWMFAGLTLFFVIVTPVYWFAAHEIIGTVALILTLAFCAMLGAFFWIQSRKIDVRPEDRKDAEVIDAAGEVGFFPGTSLWPFWSAASISVILLGPVFGWWLSLIGAAMGLWAVTGWAYQFYKGDYQH